MAKKAARSMQDAGEAPPAPEPFEAAKGVEVWYRYLINGPKVRTVSARIVEVRAGGVLDLEYGDPKRATVVLAVRRYDPAARAGPLDPGTPCWVASLDELH